MSKNVSDEEASRRLRCVCVFFATVVGGMGLAASGVLDSQALEQEEGKTSDPQVVTDEIPTLKPEIAIK